MMGVDTYLINKEKREYVWLGRVYLTNPDNIVTLEIIDNYLTEDILDVFKYDYIFDAEAYYLRYWECKFWKDYINKQNSPVVYKTDWDKDWDEFATNYALNEYDVSSMLDELNMIYGWVEGLGCYYD